MILLEEIIGNIKRISPGWKMLTRGNFAKNIKHAYPTFYPFIKHGVLTNQGSRRVLYHQESTIYEARNEITVMITNLHRSKIYIKKISPIDFGEGIIPIISCALYKKIDHFTVVCSVTWPLDDSEARVDLVLIKTSPLLLCKTSCSDAN